MSLEEINTLITSASVGDELAEKWKQLMEGLRKYPSALVAFSGGVDSSLLAYVCHLALGEKMAAVTVLSEFETPEMIAQAADFASEHSIRQITFTRNNLDDKAIQSNPKDRCYHCKLSILGMLWEYARQNGYEMVYDGQNADDRLDYRPGRKAVEETGTHSPLGEAGMTKREIRVLSKLFGLNTWDHPSSPCLASRVPYGTAITADTLRKIAGGERILHQAGFRVARVRVHDDLARIEIEPGQMDSFMRQRDTIMEQFKSIGFLYITLDLQGFRSGSMNEGLNL
jgi:uncharacterized protein